MLELQQKQVPLKTKVIAKPKKIINYLHLGISLPILPAFEKYILRDLKAYHAKAIVLEKDLDDDTFRLKTDKSVGNVLVYEDGSDTLFFGFFGVYDHGQRKIELLCDALIAYGKSKGFARIRGPINVPTMIFGWGFMAEGSTKDLFIGSPINPPIYQKKF